jgi:hypothetical protein
MDKSRMPGWYKGPITQWPEPKPVCSGTMMHTDCVTDGPLTTYKLHARTFVGKIDGSSASSGQHCDNAKVGQLDVNHP